MKLNRPNPAHTPFKLRRAALAALAVTLLCGGLAAAHDDDEDDRGRGRGNAAQLRQFISGQVGGLQKLMVPPDDASIPVPFDPARPDRYKTTPEKRFLGKMLFHDPVRTARQHQQRTASGLSRRNRLRRNLDRWGKGRCDR